MGGESQLKTKYRVQRLRMFFDDRRFYLLLAVLPKEEIDTPVINNYFNSFVVKQRYFEVEQFEPKQKLTVAAITAATILLTIIVKDV